MVKHTVAGRKHAGQALILALSLFATACGSLATSKDPSEEPAVAVEPKAADKQTPTSTGAFNAVDVSGNYQDLVGNNTAVATFGPSMSLAEDGAMATASTSVSASATVSSEAQVDAVEDLKAAGAPVVEGDVIAPSSAAVDSSTGSSEVEADAAIIIKSFDTDADGVLSEDEDALAEKEFNDAKTAWLKKVDKDGDGKVSGAEFGAAVKALRVEIREKRKARLLELFDTDGDGKFSKDERATVKDARKAQIMEAKERVGERIKAFDVNGDTKIDFEELKEFMKAQRAERKEFVKDLVGDFDKNKDGKLSDAERKMLEAARLKDRQKAEDKFDKNKDGRIDAKEMEMARDFAEAERKKANGQVDKDGDGKVSPAEKAAFMKGELFQKYDFDKNGILDQKEAAELRASTGIGVIVAPHHPPQDMTHMPGAGVPGQEMPPVQPKPVTDAASSDIKPVPIVK